MAKLLLIIAILALIVLVPFPKRKKETTPSYSSQDLKFPQGFFWGAATAAHQVEGNLDNNLTDWEKQNAQRLAGSAEEKYSKLVPNWEEIKPEATTPENYISGKAVDHYNRYEEDLDIARQIGLNAYRFSIEWSRIEPEEGQFNNQELEHYRQVIKAVKDRGMTPFVTLWHRSQPKWVNAQSEWENTKTVDAYAKYVEYVVTNLADEVDYWLPFNEPTIHIVAGYIEGNLPPQVKDLSRGKTAFDNLTAAHRRAYDIIHQKDSKAFVASTHAVQETNADPNNLINKVLSWYLYYQANHRFVDAARDQHDFIALQYYGPSRYRLTFDGVKAFRNPPEGEDGSDFGWEIDPKGIYRLIHDLYDRYEKPIIITENGIADRHDRLRAKYITDHLFWIKKAMDDGVPVQGYFHWSLMDNFEWDSGFWPRFGLIEIDRRTLERKIRPSAMELKKIIENR